MLLVPGHEHALTSTMHSDVGRQWQNSTCTAVPFRALSMLRFVYSSLGIIGL